MSEQGDLQGFVARARELGAEDAKVVEPSSIETAAWVRWKCQFGCGCYSTKQG